MNQEEIKPWKCSEPNWIGQQGSSILCCDNCPVGYTLNFLLLANDILATALNGTPKSPQGHA